VMMGGKIAAIRDSSTEAQKAADALAEANGGYYNVVRYPDTVKSIPGLTDTLEA